MARDIDGRGERGEARQGGGHRRPFLHIVLIGILHLFYCFDHRVVALEHSAEDNVLPVEVGSRFQGDEELRAVGVGARVGL